MKQIENVHNKTEFFKINNRVHNTFKIVLFLNFFHAIKIIELT